MSPDIAASVKARLLAEAKKDGAPFELFLVRSACERFLYRLGASELRERCTLKGAGLLALWMEDPHRTTRDVDLLASGSDGEGVVRTLMETICRVPCPEDGLVFDLESLAVEPIRDGQRYAGQRALVLGYLGKAKMRVQVDFGFGDVLHVPPQEVEMPTLIGRVPAPRVQAYPREATVGPRSARRFPVASPGAKPHGRRRPPTSSRPPSTGTRTSRGGGRTTAERATSGWSLPAP